MYSVPNKITILCYFTMNRNHKSAITQNFLQNKNDTTVYRYMKLHYVQHRQLWDSLPLINHFEVRQKYVQNMEDSEPQTHNLHNYILLFDKTSR